jgi:clan AA aspartic protease
MGAFSVEVEIRPARAPERAPVAVECLVDTGAAFCQFPARLMTALGIVPERHVPIVLADGSRREQPAAWVEIRHAGRRAFTLVLFGGDEGLPLLGAHALEGLGLSVDPVKRTLEPTRFPLAEALA